MLILASLCLISAAFYLSQSHQGEYPAGLVAQFPNLSVQVAEDMVLPQDKGKVVVDLYYEALCPDSRDFILYQLFPAWLSLKNIFTINYIPYGKAYVSFLNFLRSEKYETLRSWKRLDTQSTPE